MTSQPQWLSVDEGWGRKAVDFATLCEPANCREYAGLHHLLRVGPGDRLLDLACGAGLALELAAARGASCSGIDASRRLVAVARDRNPVADLRIGDMTQLPWEDASFDVVTSFRGIWATTPDAVTEARRVLRPGGRFGFTVWGHLKASPGAWALQPFTLAAPEKVAGQARMVSLGRPGAGEQALAHAGFTRIRRHEIPFVWEFADPGAYARALASTGPAYEAIAAVGEAEFLGYAEELARSHVRDGVPLRAEIKVVGYTGSVPVKVDRRARHLPDVDGEGARAAFDDDLTEFGYVQNATRLWARDITAYDGLFALLDQVSRRGGLSFRDRAALVSATASTRGDPYCALVWGQRLGAIIGIDEAAALVAGHATAGDPRDNALAAWARTLVRDPSGTTEADISALRAAGLDDDQIFAATVYVGLRLAFSTINAGLGAMPDEQLLASAPEQLCRAVADPLP